MKTKIRLIDLYARDPIKACKAALRKTSDTPEHERLDQINALLGMHGTEAIRGEWQNGYWCDIVAIYCNTGDSYAPTVIQLRGDSSYRKSTFRVQCWADFIEKNGKRLALR
tara:strand:- start:671 stop:1003 length:333 start_codon:yes stop_codon:yes gene_type:complete